MSNEPIVPFLEEIAHESDRNVFQENNLTYTTLKAGLGLTAETTQCNRRITTTTFPQLTAAYIYPIMNNKHAPE